MTCRMSCLSMLSNQICWVYVEFLERLQTEAQFPMFKTGEWGRSETPRTTYRRGQEGSGAISFVSSLYFIWVTEIKISRLIEPSSKSDHIHLQLLKTNSIAPTASNLNFCPVYSYDRTNNNNAHTSKWTQYWLFIPQQQKQLLRIRKLVILLFIIIHFQRL